MKAESAAFKRKADGSWEQVPEGLTKREYFAAMAMQSLLAQVSINTSRDFVAAEAVIAADALLEELAK